MKNSVSKEQQFHSRARRASWSVIFAALFSLICRASALGAPVDEISAAVVAGGATDIAQASRKVFLRGFTSIALQVKPRDLPAYVEAGVKLRPALAAQIVARAIRATAGRGTRGDCTLISRIVRAAIASNPEAAVAIAQAAIQAEPKAVHCIIDAAIAQAPQLGSQIAALEANFSLVLLSAITSADQTAPWHGAGSLNPANVVDLREDNPVVSPEQPPVP